MRDQRGKDRLYPHENPETGGVGLTRQPFWALRDKIMTTNVRVCLHRPDGLSGALVGLYEQCRICTNLRPSDMALVYDVYGIVNSGLNQDRKKGVPGMSSQHLRRFTLAS